MSDPCTLRILELDGGGMRGYLSLNFLQQFVQLWGIPNNTLWEHFDVICGTSIGGIMALGIADGTRLDEISRFFTGNGDPGNGGPYIFSLDDSYNNRPDKAEQFFYATAQIPYYQSSDGSPYGSALLDTTIQSLLGSTTLQQLKTNVIVPSFQQDTSSWVTFSNANYSQFIGQSALASDVALSTSAAPVYLPSWTWGGHTYLDGGLYQNNPGLIGKTLAQMLKPTATRTCLLSIGTGLTQFSSTPSDIPGYDLLNELQILFSIASTGSQESVASTLFLQSAYTLEQFYYYRFQPQLDPSQDTTLDNASVEILNYYQNLANEVFSGDIANITTFLGHLTA